MLYRDDIPCWYELSWRKKIPAIRVMIHKDFIKDAIIIDENVPIVVALSKEFGFNGFVGDFERNFGFDNSFVRGKETEEFVEFIAKIPKIKKIGKICSYCKGSGKDEDLDSKCLWCHGEKKESLYDWKSAYAISASFNVLFMLLFSFEKEIQSNLFQLIEVSTAIHKGMHGGSLGGQFSVQLCNWMDSLRESGKSSIVEMIEAMRLAYKVMMGRNPYDWNDFRASVDYEGGWLNTSCPGNACGLNPDFMAPKEGLGYNFGCHNVDTPAQQITLIAGLAALHDKARKEI